MARKHIIDNPELMSQWDYERNEGLYDPAIITEGSSKKPGPWWRCSLDHPYQQTPNAKTSQNQGCPYCAGKKVWPGFNDLATKHPDLAKEWSSENKLKATDVTCGKKGDFIWKCSVCGESWPASIGNRINGGTGCPYCTHQLPIKGKTDLETLFPYIAKEWDYSKNKNKPSDYLSQSHARVYWICPACNNSYPMRIQNRTAQHQNCPKCAKRWQTSFPEQALFYYLKKTFPKCTNGELEVLSRKHELDIYIPEIRTAIEYDGHRWHKDKMKTERDKYLLCKKENITLIRIREDSLEPLDNISDMIIVSHYNQGKKLSEITEPLNLLAKHLGINININLVADEPAILSQYYSNLYERSLEVRYPELAKEWDPVKNEGLTPSMISPGDKHKFWWICPECDSSYQAAPLSRLKGSGHRECSRKRAAMNNSKAFLKKNGSLADLYPEIAAEWDYEANYPLTPDEVTSKTNKKVWWRCPLNHPYPAFISDRTGMGSGCSVCAGKRVLVGYNDLATKYPGLVLDWDYDKNEKKPEDYTPGSNKKVHWKCHVCDYEWETFIYRRALKGTGCRRCAARLRSKKNQSK